MGNGSKYVANASKEIRMGFVRKVYSILSVQLLVTVAIAAPIAMKGPVFAQTNQSLLAISTGVLLMTMFVPCCCPEALKTFPTNYIFLALLTCATGVLVGMSSAMYTLQSVVLAAGVTVGIFFAMTLYACCAKTDFTGAGPYLIAALFAMIMFSMVLLVLSMCGIYPKMLLMAYDFIGVLLFTFYIVYDTQLIMGSLGGHKIMFEVDDYVYAAMQLYLDIINLFLYLLELLGDRR